MTKNIKSTNVATKDNVALATWENYTGPTGYEDTDKSELAIPFINLLQDQSALVKAGDAKRGQFYNNVMETVHDELKIIPCARQRVFVEWVPIKKGGGFAGIHAPESEFVQEALAENAGSPIGLSVGGNQLVETIHLYSLILDDDGGFMRAILSFSSTKLKKYRHFFAKATSQTIRVGDRKVHLPLWAHRWILSSEEEFAKNGDPYSNFSLRFDGKSAKDCRLSPDDELFKVGQAFHKMVSGGIAQADLSETDEIPF